MFLTLHMRTSFNIDPSQWPELWQASYRLLSESIVPEQLRAWIDPLEFRGTEESPTGFLVHFAAPNDWSARWVNDHYKKNIEGTFSQITGAPCELQITVQEKRDQEVPPPPSVLSADYGPISQNFTANAPTSTTASSRSRYESAVEPKHTFESFVVGASNQFAHASAVAVAEAPARQYNPLFIYSTPGLGKTHLLHAIGNHIMAQNPNARVAYLSAEQFVNELIDSIQHKQMSEFRTKYRNSFDVILIDDIQFIAGKDRSEEEFFHTFNALHNSKRQIVVTSDRPPKEIEGLEERVRTRFLCGLVADIQPPEIETRIAILKAKAERDDIYLPDEVATFLATHIKSNVRELEGHLIRLQAQASLTGAEISLEMAKQELSSSIPDESSHLTIESIQSAVAKHYRIKVQDLKSTSRTKTVALPRQIAMYLIRKYCNVGFKEIGQYFGGKDHTTIIHACNKIESGLDGDPEIRNAVESIQNLL